MHFEWTADARRYEVDQSCSAMAGLERRRQASGDQECKAEGCRESE